VSDVSCGGLRDYIESRTGKTNYFPFSWGGVGQDDSVERYCMNYAQFFYKFYKRKDITRILIQKLLSSSI
jgi:hypothetical protein